jgi:hypothetical protein
MPNANVDTLVRRVDTYLAVLRLSGNYKERQRINLSNQALPGFIDEARREVLSAVARGALCDAFLRDVEARRPTAGRPLPEQFAAYISKALEGK